jgi:hypothetical protein
MAHSNSSAPLISRTTLENVVSRRVLLLQNYWNEPYSPDWNPDEKVWNHLKHQDLKGHQARTRDELKDLTQKKLTEMSHDRELLQGIFFRCCVANLLE